MTDPDRLRFTSGGGCLMLFGLPFFAMGLFVMLSPLLGVEMTDTQSGQPASPLFLITFGSIFAAVGGTIMFGRKGVEIDRRHEQVSSWWGLLVPFRRTTRPLADFDRVTITSEVRRSKNSSYTVYPVRLAPAEGGGDAVSLRDLRDPQRAREEAERAAKFLHMGIMDETMTPPCFREAGTLDMSLREQLRDAPPPEPQLPSSPRATYSREGRTTCSVEIPAAGFNPVTLVIGVVALLFPAVFVGFFLSAALSGPLTGKEPWSAGHFVFLGFGAVMVLVGGLGPLLTLTRLATSKERLSISPDAVTLRRAWKLGTSEKSIPMDELEEVELSGAAAVRQTPLGTPSGSVQLRSDRLTLALGRALPPSEQEWLRDLIRYCAATGTCPEQR